MPQPFIPEAANAWLTATNGTSMMRQFPLNLAAANLVPEKLQQDIFSYVQRNYLWPQVIERQSFETLWDKVLKLARVNLDAMDLNFAIDTRAGKEQAESGRRSPKVSDSVIFDAIDRLSNINHFISFKEGLPMQYVVPEYIEDPYETEFYAPYEKKIKAGNALLAWNASNEDFYLKHLICCRHHYTYGVSFARSEFQLKVQLLQRQNNLGQLISRREITKIGTTFDPLSIRRLWLNYRLPAHEMESQPCPFYFEETPHFAIMQNAYNPDINPFGFVNLEKLLPGRLSYIYSNQETAAVSNALQERMQIIAKSLGANEPDVRASGLASILKPEHNVDALWTIYPMLPLDEGTGDWEKYPDGTPVIPRRFIMQTYGSNLVTKQVLLRLQRNFYPKDGLPIYSSSHMPDLDSGLYAPCLGEILFNHYKEIVTCTNQFIENKDWINNPPAWIQTSSPSVEEDLNAPNAKLKVNGQNDFGWKTPYDATSSTVQLREMLRGEAQTTSKAVDAILGKAMGGRTSATEASNAYQASMSGITTDINIMNAGISGGYAQRVWDYSGVWLDPDLLFGITGQFGFAIKPEDMWLSIGIKTNAGSTYIASIVRQQNLRYVAESTRGEPSVRRAQLYLELFKELKFGNPKKLVDDGGVEREVMRATMQAQRTYLGEPVNISPDQNHQIALMVKTAFIEDETGPWNTKFPEAIPMIIQQIELHQQFLMLQMQLQLATMQTGMPPPNSGGLVDPAMMQLPGRGGPAMQAGQLAQQGGSPL